MAFGFIETRLTAVTDQSNIVEVGSQKVQLGIPDQMRALGAP